jgi:hypothetical protein
MYAWFRHKSTLNQSSFVTKGWLGSVVNQFSEYYPMVALWCFEGNIEAAMVSKATDYKSNSSTL